jgi:hypothetical protein
MRSRSGDPMLKEMIQSLLPTRIVVVRSSAHAAKIADAIRKIPPLDSDISVALDSVGPTSAG